MKIAVFSFFLLAGSCLLAQSTSIPVVNKLQPQVLNYTNTNEVLLNKKLEFGLAIPQNFQDQIVNFLKKVETEEKLNPFLEWEVDVQFSFIHIESGFVQPVDAFYFVDYERNVRKNDWIEVATKQPFRARFCPTKTGEWMYTVALKVKGKEVLSSDKMKFTVIPSDAHGFTTLHPNQRNIQVDDKIVLPIGHNFVSPVNGVDSYTVSPNKTNKAASVQDWLAYHKDIKEYHQLGGHYFRFVQTAWSSLIEFEEKGNYYNRLHYAWEQDKLLEYCEQNGMMLNFNFLFQEPMMNFGQYYSAIWDFSHYEIQPDQTYKYNENDPYLPYCYNDSVGKQPHEMFLDDEDLKFHEQRMRYYISRYGYSTSIMMFEFLSESWHLDQYYPGPSYEMLSDEQGELVRKALLTYNDRMSEFIKVNMQHKDHLIGLHAFDNTIHWQNPVASKILDPSAQLKNIDVVGYSTYKNEPFRLIITRDGRGTQLSEGENSFYQKNVDFWAAYGKPVMHFEQGSVSDAIGANEASNFTPHNIDVRTVGFTGCSGLFAWEGMFQDEKRDTRIAWPGTVLAEKWMNNPKVIEVLQNSNGTWSQGRQAEKHSRRIKKATKETEYYVAGDMKSAAGFVLNRTYNSYTMSTTSEMKSLQQRPMEPFDTLTTINYEDGRPLYVSNLLPKMNYTITWYDWNTMESLGTQTLKATRKGEFVLEFPELTLDPEKLMRPMVWYTLTISE